MESKIFIKNRHDKKIAVVVRETENQKGLVFVMHGLGGFKEQPHIKIIADTFFSNGFTVINFDATNSIGESDGKFEEGTTQGHYEDLVDVINWAKKEPWYVEPFVLAGHSLGGYAVAKYAEDYPKEVKAIFPLALLVAGQLYYDSNKKFFPEKLKNWEESRWLVEESRSHPGIIKRLPWSWMEEVLKHDLRPNVSKLTMPVLLAVGDKDTACPEDSQILYELLNTNKELHIIKDAPHTFREPEHLDEIKSILDKWIKNNL